MSLREAAADLKKSLFGFANPSRPHGSIGISETENLIYVYMYVGRRRWYGIVPSQWKGYSIVWCWNVGRPIANAVLV